MARKTRRPPKGIEDWYAYDPKTGKITYRRTIRAYGGFRYRGEEAGTDKDGYVHIGFRGTIYRAHRLAWYFMTGDWLSSKQDMDHINGDRADNRWENLRLATRSQNMLNKNNALRHDNVSGYRGVSWREETGKWHARITIDGKIVLLGDFRNKEDAVEARKAAELEWSKHRIPKRSNSRSVEPRSDNTSGHPGVQWRKDNKKWRAVLTIGGIRVRLGEFANKDDAIAARRRAEEEMT